MFTRDWFRFETCRLESSQRKCRCDHQTVRVNTTHLNFYLASSVSATRHNSATLVLRNVGVYILARYKNFPTPLWKFFPVFAWTFSLFPLFMKSFIKFFPVFQIWPRFPPLGGKWPVYISLDPDPGQF